MLQALDTAATGMQAQEMQIQVIANNLANASTPGFKVSRAREQDQVYIDDRLAGSLSSQQSFVPTGTSVGLGVRTAAVDKIFTQGELNNTGNPLDVAIEGDGFVQIQLPGGQTAYTRDGSMRVNQNGQFTTLDGYLVMPAVTVPSGAENLTISQGGQVSAQINNSAAPAVLGQIQLVRFVNPGGLQPYGQNLYLQSIASGPPQVGVPGQNGYGTIMQGYLEMPNESVVTEMVNLIEAQQAYEAGSKATQVAAQMMSTASNLVTAA
ncbi:MAG: flagellar basal-body rod protein FlgG [Candidatus Binataceae bacterium]